MAKRGRDYWWHASVAGRESVLSAEMPFISELIFINSFVIQWALRWGYSFHLLQNMVWEAV